MAGNRIRGITVEIGGDTTKLQTALKGVNTEIRNTQSQLKDVEKLLKLDPGNTELIAQKHRLLAQAVSETREKLETLKTAQQQADEALRNGTISQDQYDALQREIIETEQRLRSLEEQVNQSATALQKIGATGEKLQTVGNKISSVGQKLLPVTGVVTGLGTAAVKTAADFDSAMSRVAAVSGATGSDFDSLRDKAREMGAKTKFSATEAADAMNYMAMAGWKTEDMLSGIEGVMYLAAASGEDLATTSDIVTDALTAFGLTAADSGHFADVLAAASSNANTNVSMMGETFKYCAPVAGALGFSVEDTAEAIGLMGNAGIKASQAGTSMRSIMTNLTGDVKLSGAAIGDVTIATTNADGSMRSLSAILADCRGAFAGMTEAEKANNAEALVGKNAMSGFLALMNAAPEDIEKVSGAVNNCKDAAKNMADTMQDNLEGQLTILKSQLQELAISFGDLLMPAVRSIVSGLQGMVDVLNVMPDGVECIILSVNDTYMDAQEVMHMTDYSKITALYSRLSVGDEDRDGGESNSIQNQRIFLENYARGQHLTNIRHYIDDDESGRFFDRSAYSRMMDDVENGKIGVCIMKDLTRWGRDYLQVGNAMEIFRRNNVRFIAVNNGIDSEKPDTLEFAPFINIMSEWYAKDISKKVKTGIKTKGMSGKPIVTEAPYGYVKDPDNKDFWIIDEEAAEVVRLIFRLFIGGKNRNQIAVHLTQEQIPTPTFYMKDRGRGTCKNKTLNEDNRCKWNKVTLTNILTRQEYCGDVVNFKTTKHFRDKHNHYVDRSQWHITENVHEPIISRSDFETVQRILENAPVRRPNGDGEIHPLSGLLFCKDCGAKMHIRIDYRNGGKRHVAYCSEYHKGKAKNPKCHSPHIMDADLLMQTIAEVLKKIEDYSISNRAEFEALVKKNLAMQQTDQTKKQQKRIPQITTRLEQIDKVLNKLYEDNALGTIPQDRYEQMSQKYSEEYYALKAELATLQEQLSAYENAGGRAQKFLKLTERHAAFTELTPAILNEFISRIEVHERDQKRARYAIQHISIYFNYIGKFENEVTQLAEPTEQEIRQMREEIEEAKKEKSRAYHRQYSREYRARNLEKQREYDRMKAREYRARRKAQAAAAQPTQ